MIIARSPLRISFAGGGTDIRDFYTKEGFGAVCSMSISKYVYVTLNNLSAFFPHRFRVAYSQTELVSEVSAIRHPIVRETLKALQVQGGIDVNVMADVPAGTGMGSSSCFTVTMLHALHAFRNQLVAKEVLAREASRLEIDELKEPIGKQDQYAAAFGGVNLFRFQSDESVAVEPVPMSRAAREKLVRSLLLVYLGGNRSASQLLKTQAENAELNRATLIKMREQAVAAARILSGDPSGLDELGELMLEGWELKRSLATGISSDEVESWMKAARSEGAIGGKLLGAGGTGFLLLYVPDERREAVRRKLSVLPEVHFSIDELGSTLLYYGPSD